MPEDLNRDAEEKFSNLLYRFIGSMEHVPNKLELLEKLINQLQLQVNDYKGTQKTLKEDHENVKKLFFEFKREYRETKITDDEEDREEERKRIEYDNSTDQLLEKFGARLSDIEGKLKKREKTYKDIVMWVFNKIGYIVVAAITAFVVMKVKGS